MSWSEKSRREYEKIMNDRPRVFSAQHKCEECRCYCLIRVETSKNKHIVTFSCGHSRKLTEEEKK